MKQVKIPKLVAKTEVWWWNLLGELFPRTKISWTTIGYTIYYPFYVEDPLDKEYDYVRTHEHRHIMQQEKMWLPLWIVLYLFFPVPIFFSWFRWQAERQAYETELRAGASIDALVEVLWSNYLYPWPKSWMKKWFTKRLEEMNNDAKSQQP
jgi:hypothetical protein